MIVHQPIKSITRGRVRISAFIEIEGRPELSDTLWFEFPADMSESVSGQSNAFAAALLPAAMALGRPLAVRGGVSPKLLAGLGKVQDLFHGWLPAAFSKIDIHCERLEVESADTAGAAPAAAFSGGIDSFFTLITHLPRRAADPGQRLKYILFVHGFDIPSADRRTYGLARESYEKMAAGLGVRLIAAASNFRDLRLTRSVPWDMACGPALIGAALSLAPVFSRFFVPSTHRHAEHLVQGCHPLVDPNFSTETLEVVHDGIDFSRSQKTKVIAEFQPSYDNLRVCWVKPDGVRNCGRCQKCLRTMIALDLLGALPRYTTFSRPLPKKLDNWVLTCENDVIFAEDVRELAVERGAVGLAADIERAVRRSRSTIALAEKISGALGWRGHWLEKAVCYGLFLFHGPAVWSELYMRFRPRRPGG